MKNIEIENNWAILRINPKIYPVEVIYSAAYVFLDKAYILLDGDPKSEIIIRIKPKNKEKDKELLGLEFFNELINYADYRQRSEETKNIREALLQRALLTNDQSSLMDSTNNKEETDAEFEKILKTLDEDEDILDDPDGIAIPWEEKYGKNKETAGKEKQK